MAKSTQGHPGACQIRSAPLRLPANLFWDVNPAALDAEKHAAQIIGRVVELGGIDGWRRARAHHGDDRLRAVVMGRLSARTTMVNALSKINSISHPVMKTMQR